MSTVQNQSSATSIFEFLTHRNPPVHHHAPTSKTLTRSPRFHFPRQLLPWSGFNFRLLEEVYGGHLMQEARQKRRQLPPYPTIILETDCEIYDEEDTKELYNKWTKTIVTAASIPILSRFHPAIWKLGKAIKREDSATPPKTEGRRRQPSRQCSDNARRPRKQSLHKLRPDSGAISLQSTLTDANSVMSDNSGKKDHSQLERFPKEFKSAAKWKSEWLWENDLIDENGKWIFGKENENIAWPIRQAFTYCIRSLSRYGCILTCHEAFIFRISPRNENLRYKLQEPELDLEHSLIENGLMEYISIPWGNHRPDRSKNYNEWTVSLALWFVHVLAGDEHEVEWAYTSSKLDGKVSSTNTHVEATAQADEETKETEDDDTNESITTDDSEKTQEFENSSSQKRKRDPDDEDNDAIHGSFARRSFTSSYRD